ncbi:hypothetical protein KY336_02410 [Candidatus Woesearchaeota archaeon]|nr:hypothetical protein [Candidatus Woesearchaeota archaeon]
MWPLTSIANIASGILGFDSLEAKLANFDPSTDRSFTAISPNEFKKEIWYLGEGGKVDIQKTKIVEFDKEEDMRQGLFLYAHYNVFGKLLDEDWHQMTVHSWGYNKKREKWFFEIDFLGEGKDYADLIREEEDPTKIYNMLEKIIDKAVLMEVAAPEFLKDPRKLRKHGADKAHRGISEYVKSLSADGVQTDVVALRKGLNTLLDSGILKIENFFTDSFPGNWIPVNGKPARIDMDGKQGWFFGNFNAPHIAEYSSKLSTEQREKLKQHYVTQYNNAVNKYNDYVKTSLAKPKDTVCELIDTYLHLDKERADALKRKIKYGRNKRNIEDYVKTIEKFEPALKDKIYMIKNHLANLKERETIDEEKFEVFYQASKLVRALASCGGKGDRRRKETDPEKFMYLYREQRFQLENAIEAARYLEQYSGDNMWWFRRSAISKIRATLEKDYERMYNQKFKSKKEKQADLVANPIRLMPIDYDYAKAA